MQKEFDKSLYEQELKAEYNAALKEIQSLGHERALIKHRDRLQALHNQELEKSGEKLACGKGCRYCCYFKVDVRADEVFDIITYMRNTLPVEQLKTIRADILANAKAMKKLDKAGQVAANLKCAFLVDGACSIYPVRPAHCRTFHAKDVSGCITSYEEPLNTKIPISMINSIYAAEAGCTGGYKRALHSAGYSVAHYEMSMALSLSLTDANPKKKWAKKKKAYPVTYETA